MKTLKSICRELKIDVKLSPSATAEKTEHIKYKGIKIGYISDRISKKGAYFGYSFPGTLNQDGFPINEKMKWIGFLKNRFGGFSREWLLKEESKNSYYFLVYEIDYLESLLKKEVEQIDCGTNNHP